MQKPSKPHKPQQLFEILAQQILSGVYREGEKLPSLRSLARQSDVSKNSVVSAFEMLVARGLVEPRRGSGFYVRAIAPDERVPQAASQQKVHAMNIVWLLQTQLAVQPGQLAVGDAFMPPESMEKLRIDRYYPKIARSGIRSMSRYGDRLGYLALRRVLARNLTTAGLACEPDHIMLTHGANEAMELLVRYGVSQGHTVLTDEPGYYPLIAKLKMANANVVGIERQPDGPCLQALEQAIVRWRPRLFFTQSAMQNPTGSFYSETKARQVVALCAAHNVLVVDNDSLSGLYDGPTSKLAQTDQLHSTVHVGSFSKTISPALRVGFLVAAPALVDALADIRTLLNISSAEYCERTVEAIIEDPSYERFLQRQRSDLRRATAAAQDKLRQWGAEVFCDYRQSLFLWARFPEADNSLELARALQIENVMLAPGALFSVDFSQPSAWSRCNPFALADPRFDTALRAVRNRVARGRSSAV
ncbi:PLP-dependent aminotransferase family protein [Lampropedia aestuarii]|uniref:PLP-dependent aminotransferase family protein n=1 Tax=Lampropedia aestuarii TaxID=2562762 RepID=A0A4S5BUY7_9BURK|nr:PLP-dependent aminotransferase family protein [Lampropedia aestuarii]MDH5856705.1 PLP-dependent aminotransferase family protein [Lampropedia aestuarii]THJ34961.1 PLP-dependent aminotransferase family protein [Lampropedia aestuarii]